MHETTDTPALVENTAPARELTNDCHRTYAIEDEDQAQAYVRLAALAAAIDAEGGLILSVAPSYEDDEGGFYTIVVTVCV